MNPEKLRVTYNKYFSQGKNNWSSTDLRKTLKVTRRTLRWLNALGSHKPMPKFLDVGCATGYYTESFRLLGCQAIGLDYSEVAIEQAKNNFPLCQFIHMNGFDPVFTEEFDIIFCRGFSGANTHDLDFIADWVNKYMQYLSPDGFFVLAYSSDFSGKEKKDETVNLTKQELSKLVKLIRGTHRGTFLFQYYGPISILKKKLMHYLIRRNIKEYYYILIQNA